MKRKRPAKEFATAWLFEAFDRDPTYCQKRMFGCLAAYVRGQMVMVLAEDPGEKSYRGRDYGFDLWDGVMFPTERAFHESLMKDFPGLVPHPVLGKWLYLPARHEDFESMARDLARRIALGDRRLGIEPGMKERKAAKRGVKKKAPRRRP